MARLDDDKLELNFDIGAERNLCRKWGNTVLYVKKASKEKGQDWDWEARLILARPPM